MLYDELTGKILDKLSDFLPVPIDEHCEECGTRLISRCLKCGAPICCPKCCYDIEIPDSPPERRKNEKY